MVNKFSVKTNCCVLSPGRGPDAIESQVVSVILVSLLPLLVLAVLVIASFYWYRIQRRRKLNEWETKKPLKRKGPKGPLDCSDACAIMMDDDRSDSSSTHANSLNHNTEPLPIELDLQVRTINKAKT